MKNVPTTIKEDRAFTNSQKMVNELGLRTVIVRARYEDPDGKPGGKDLSTTQDHIFG